MTPLSHICSESGVIVLVGAMWLSPVHCPPFVISVIPHSLSLLSPHYSFITPHLTSVCLYSPLFLVLNKLPAICWHRCFLELVFAGIHWHWHWHWHWSALFIIVVLSSIVISTIISPYEQWLAGGVVVLYDVALGVAAV